MSLESVLRHIRHPELARTAPQRLRTYVVVNLVAIAASVVGLFTVWVTVLPSPEVRVVLWVLVSAGLLVAGALVLSQRARAREAALLVVLANWTVALAITWVSPFITPVALLVLLIPLVIVVDNLPGRARTALVLATVLLSGLLPAMGELRREDYVGPGGDRTLRAALVAVFVPLIVGVIVLGLRDSARRLRARTRELELSRARLAAAADDARRGIERDLHDGAQQRLATLAVDLGRAVRLCESDPVQARVVVDGLRTHLDAAIRDLRDLAHGIYPALLGERGLSGALPAAARRTALPCTVDTVGVERYDRDVEAAVYFCCLEAIQNADRHSVGSMIRVDVTDDGDGTLRFRVADDGIGFAVGSVPRSHGLTGMRDRIRAAGGEVTVVSAPGAGTVVEGVVRGARRRAVRARPPAVVSAPPGSGGPHPRPGRDHGG